MRTYRDIFLLFLFSVAAILPAYIFGFGGHDAHIHGLWTKQFSQLLSQGYIYPRLANDMFAGFGSYVFFFYPPVSLYFNSLFAFLGHDYDFYYPAIAASANLALFVSGITTYFWLRSKVAAEYALILAFLYMVLPLHLLVDFYITAGISQFWSYAWLPMILYGIEKTCCHEKYATAILASFLALLVTTNIPAAIIFIPLSVLYGLAISGKNCYRLIPGYILALLLASVYILPVFSYRDLVNIDLHWAKNAGFYYSDYFLDKKLFTADSKDSYRLTILLCGVLTYICLIFFLSKLTTSRVRSFIIAVSAIIIFLCFSISDFIWQIFTPLQIIQFPRRLLIIPSIFIILVAGELSVGAQKKIRNMICAFVMIFFIASCIIAKQSRPNMQSADVAQANMNFAHNIEAFPNYLPGKDLINNFYPLSPRLAKYPQVEISNGAAEIKKWQSRDIEIIATATSGSILKIRQFYFPYWRAYINGRAVAVLRDNSLGIINIVVDKDVDKGPVQLKLETLPAERLGIWLSAIGFILLLLTMVRDARKKPL